MLKNSNLTVGRAALIAGLAVLVMALTVPIVEFYIFPKLVDYRNAAKTTQNITNNTVLFSLAIFIHFLTVICDIVSGWALYIFLKPANKNLALVSAWFRIVNAAFTIAALANLVQVLSLLKTGEYFTSVQPNELNDLILFRIHSFNLQWRFMLVFFGIYMNLLGFLVLQAKYVPTIMGIFLILTGAGYIIDNLKYFFYPEIDTGFLWFTYFGELVFMFWLLIKGRKVRLT
ncbi:MAG: DUF4386 domain-containing protein [Cyclobacteriaceae bacterium]